MMDGDKNRPVFESLPTPTKCDLRSVTTLESLTSCLWYVEKRITRQSQSRGPISSCFLDCSHSNPGGASSLTGLPPEQKLQSSSAL